MGSGSSLTGFGNYFLHGLQSLANMVGADCMLSAINMPTNPPEHDDHATNRFRMKQIPFINFLSLLSKLFFEGVGVVSTLFCDNKED